MQGNNVEKQGNKAAGKSAFVKRFCWILIFMAVVAAIGILVFLWWTSRGAGSSNKQSGTFTVRRDDLAITVTESGNIKAINSIDIKSEVKGRTKIISIVDEGTYITLEDVNNGMILVELDSSDIQQRLTEREISFLSAKAGFTDANESLDIQKKQNDSDIKAGQMKVRFALMDMQKYLGGVVADELMRNATNPGLKHNKIAQLVYEPNLGGEALQRLRELDGDIYLKRQQLELAKSKWEWTEKLYEKEYVSLSDKEADRLDKETKDLDWEKAKTEKSLFVRYEFPKQAEKLLSDNDEAKREFERIEARARSKLAQAQAKLDSTKATYFLQQERLAEQRKQLKACVIRAPAPGQVVYSSSMGSEWQRRNRPIEVGADIQERQKIISIPDTSEMKVEIKVHETWIDKLQPGQKAKITVAAFPEQSFTGSVLKKAPLADPENWMNPDLKVYSTDVSIDGEHKFLKTGMTGKVEVTIEQLEDVISVPIQTVVNLAGKEVCYVVTGKKPQQREVETGAFNTDFVEIKSGLAVGERVLLNPPRLLDSDNR